MPFVASPAQLRTFNAITSSPQYTQETLAVPFTTTIDFIASILPPHLSPIPEQPTGLITIGNWQSNTCGDFELCSVAVKCRHGEREGYYMLTLIVSEPFAITWGRETWGEIKKPGKVRMFGNGKKNYAYCERKGVRLVEVDVELGAWDEGEAEEVVEWCSFEMKAVPAAQGEGLQGGEGLGLTLKAVDRNEKRAKGKGRVVLRGSESDPLHEIPIMGMGEVKYFSGRSDWSVLEEYMLKGGEKYLPYVMGRQYDVFEDCHVAEGLTDHTDRQSGCVGASEARTFYSS